MDTTVADPLLGTVLDRRYRLDRRIARGGMSTVYAGLDERLDRTVAVKVMHPGLAEDPEFLARFTREARATARLSSPYVVSVFDQGSHDGLAYLVMELVRGRTLRDLLAERGRLSPAEAVAVLEPVLIALTAAHREGLVHRDVKPENVLLGESGSVKVADFGLVRAVEASAQTATRGMLIGTVAYLAPEQVSGGTVDERTDVYAAGILLFEMLTGAPPYAGETAMSVAFRHVHSDVPPPSTVTSVPEALDELTVAATRREPGARPADAGAFLAELRDVRTDLGLPSVAVPTPSGRVGHTQPHHTLAVPADDGAPGPDEPPRRRSRKGFVAVLVVLLLAALAAGSGWWFGAGRYRPAPSFYGLTRTQAHAKAQQAGLHLRYDGSVYSETVPKQSVADQDPAATHRVLRGGTVTLTLSKGPERFTIPALAGQSRTDAVAALHHLHLQPKVSEIYSRTVDQGLVVSVNPAPGASVARNTVVTVQVSKGPPPVDVPKVVGKSLSDAKAALARAGLGAEVTRAYDDTAAKGQVTAQDPQGGQLPVGSTVTITVSKGPHLYPVPDVTGQSVPEARRILREAGFDARVIGGSHQVIQQIPGAGAKERRGTTVTLLASLF